MSQKLMIVAGVMSGTSADGINVALVRLPARASSRQVVTLLGHAEYSYPAKVRSAVLSAMNAPRASVADLARLNFLLGELYADAVLATQRQFRMKADLVGCHGQTLYHQGDPRPFLGRKVTATWQTGEAAVIAERVGVPVVSDFRPADMAASGKGAPLVPYLDYLLFRDLKINRMVQNIGGIANLTAIPAGADADRVFAFDTGPGNMVIDAVTEALLGKAFDRGGKIAASGKVLEVALGAMLRAQILSRAASEDRRTRGIRERVCTRVPARMRALSQRRCGGYSDRADDSVDHRRCGAICDDAIGSHQEIWLGNDPLRRWRQERDSGQNVGGESLAAGSPLAIVRRIRPAIGGQRGGSIRGAGLRDVEPSTIECAVRHGREASGDSRKDLVCMRTAPWIPDHGRPIHLRSDMGTASIY